MKNAILHFFRSRGNTQEGLEAIKALFSKFRSILELNTKFLEKIAEMELSLSGEYVFDSAYLTHSARELTALVYQVVYSLNALSNNRYVGLFDRFQSMRAVLENILEGGLGPYGNRLTVPGSVIRWEMESLVGQRNASLGEIANSLGYPVQDGFVITSTACGTFLEENALWERIEGLGHSTASEGERRRELKECFQRAVVSEELKESIEFEIDALFDRRERSCRLYMDAEAIQPSEDEGRSGWSPTFILNVERDSVIEHYKGLLADRCCEYISRARSREGDGVPGFAVGVRAMINADVSGSVYTVNPEMATLGTVLIEAGSCRGGEFNFDNDMVERYVARKSSPFDLLESTLHVKPLHSDVSGGKDSLEETRSGLLRGSALLSKRRLNSIVEAAIGIERVFEFPQTIFWAAERGEPQTILATVSINEDLRDSTTFQGAVSEMEEVEPLLTGGETAQIGVATGKVFHVSDNTVVDDFPAGGVAVARKATPGLSRILRKASALVTEMGSPAGHLATIAREFRIPTIVGAADARRCLPEGCEVTVDAEERNVYKGLIEALLRYRSVERGGVSSEPEYKTLRQMLRWIVPLRLIDPESPEFVVSNCESLHDIIHFSHEKAVEEIVNLRERHSHLRRYQPHVLDVDIPIHLVMLDMGGGLSREIGQRVPVSDVRSVPFNAFLRGVLLDDVWERQPSRLSLKSVVSGMDRTQRMLTDQPEFVGQNLAIIAHNYMNLSLRLGYHFNVIDTYLSESVNENYIYFRFVGGFADPLKRKRRVELIKRVLERFNFKVKIKGDLVVGKLKMEEIQVMEGVLEQIGKLVAFTRQLDVKLASNGNVDSFYQLFLKKMENQLVDPFL